MCAAAPTPSLFAGLSLQENLDQAARSPAMLGRE